MAHGVTTSTMTTHKVSQDEVYNINTFLDNWGFEDFEVPELNPGESYKNMEKKEEEKEEEDEEEKEKEEEEEKEE